MKCSTGTEKRPLGPAQRMSDRHPWPLALFAAALVAVSLAAALAVLALGAATASAAPPANDDFSAAATLSGASDSDSGTNVDATAQAGEPSASGPINSVWWDWMAPFSGPVRVDTCGSDLDTFLAVYTGAAVGSLSLLAANDDTCNLQSRVDFTATMGTPYRIAVDGFSAATGSIEIAVAPVGIPPANDDFSAAFTLSGASDSDSRTNFDATFETGEPSHAGSGPTRSVWWDWIAPGSGATSVDTCGSGFDTLLGVYTGAAVDSLSEVASNNDSCGLQSKVDFTATAGVNYWIAVDGFGGDEGNVELTVVGPGAPTPPTPTPPPPPADTSAPGGDLKAKGSQKAGKAIKIKVGPLNEAGKASATGKVIVKGARKALPLSALAAKKKKVKFKLGKASGELVAGEIVTLKLKQKGGKKKKRKLVKLVKRGAEAKAKITITLTDLAGNSTSEKLVVKLKK